MQPSETAATAAEHGGGGGQRFILHVAAVFAAVVFTITKLSNLCSVSCNTAFPIDAEDVCITGPCR